MEVCMVQDKSSVMCTPRNSKLETLSTASLSMNIGLGSILLVFLKSTTIFIVFLLLGMRLLLEHQALRFHTSSLYADSSLLEIRPMTGPWVKRAYRGGLSTHPCGTHGWLCSVLVCWEWQCWRPNWSPGRASWHAVHVWSFQVIQGSMESEADRILCWSVSGYPFYNLWQLVCLATCVGVIIAETVLNLESVVCSFAALMPCLRWTLTKLQAAVSLWRGLHFTMTYSRSGMQSLSVTSCQHQTSYLRSAVSGLLAPQQHQGCLSQNQDATLICALLRC